MIEVKLSVEEYNRLFMLYLDRDFDDIFCKVQNDSIIFVYDRKSDDTIARVNLNTPAGKILSNIRRIQLMDNNNLTRARECSFRKDNLCGKAKSCELCSYMRNIKKLWIRFCDTPIQYSRTGCTTEEFNSFPIGTFRADIVDWFYKTFEVDIDALKEMTGRYDNKNSEDIPEYIKESNRIKKETCKSCMEQLKDVLSDKQLERFEDVFYSAVNGDMLKRKESVNGSR